MQKGILSLEFTCGGLHCAFEPTSAGVAPLWGRTGGPHPLPFSCSSGLPSGVSTLCHPSVTYKLLMLCDERERERGRER